jgi:hypothetical protein
MDDELKTLMQQQLEAQQALIEASKAEATAHTLKIEESKKLQALEAQRVAEEKRHNELLEHQLTEALEVRKLLMYNFENKPIEASIEKLRMELGSDIGEVKSSVDWMSQISEGMRVISELVARELLRMLSRDANSIRDKESLMQAIIQIGKERSRFDLGTHFSSQGDINTRDVGDKTNTKE